MVFWIEAAVLLAVLLIYFNGAERFWEGALLSYGLWPAVDWYDALVWTASGSATAKRL